MRAIRVDATRFAGDGLAIAFLVDADLRHLRIPEPVGARAATRLWEHTCCEAFIAREGAQGYHEFNFSPSGEYAGYAFCGYRQARGSADDAVIAPLAVRVSTSGLELHARLNLAVLSWHHGTDALRLGLSAVMETTNGTQSYWALRHAGPEPDFHHGDAFALRLEASDGR